MAAAAARALLGLAAGKGRAAAAASGRGPLAAAPLLAPLLAGRATTAPPLAGLPRAPPLAGQPRAPALLAHQAPPLLAGRSTLVAALLGAPPPPRVAGLRLLRPAPLPALGPVRFSTGGTNHGDGDGDGDAKIDASVPESGFDHILADSSAKPKPDAARGTDADNATDNGLKPDAARGTDADNATDNGLKPDAAGKDEHHPKPKPDGDNATDNGLKPDAAGKDEHQPKPKPDGDNATNNEVGIHTTAVAVPRDSTGTLSEHNDKCAGSEVPAKDKEEVDGKDGKAATGENRTGPSAGKVVVDSEEDAGKVRIDTVVGKDTTEEGPGEFCTNTVMRKDTTEGAGEFRTNADVDKGYGRLEDLLEQNNELLKKIRVEGRVGRITQTLVIGLMVLLLLLVAGVLAVMYGVSIGVDKAHARILVLSQDEKSGEILYNMVAMLIGFVYQKGKDVVVNGTVTLGTWVKDVVVNGTVTLGTWVMNGAANVGGGMLRVAGAAWHALSFWTWRRKVEEKRQQDHE